ncbi:HpcH/HpaI aldolase/citrate lyase family protein [Chloroflexota bacterium]
MRTNKVKELWKAGKTPTIAWMNTPDTLVASVMANVGFDVLLLDMQHGMGIGPDRAALWIQAVATTDTVPFVRVPWNEPFFIQWVLDAGALGIVVPLVNNYEEAAKAGGACRYPPIGYRSTGANFARLHWGSDYAQRANEEVVCLVMIESVKTLPNLDEMATAPGIDGFYVGPGDLALSLGIKSPAERADSKEHADACQQVLDVANKHGIIPGIHCGSPEEVLRRQAQGFKFCQVMTDMQFLAAKAEESLKAIK